MDIERKLMQFYFITAPEISNHYHQNPEFFYVLEGNLEVKIDDQVFYMKSGDIVLINANKRHWVRGDDKLLAARFEIDFHQMSEYMGTMQLLFWCNTIADKNEAYTELRRLLDRIISRYFEKDEKDALYLNALYFETAYVLTSNFLIKSDDKRMNLADSQDRMRIRQIQNYIQSNYQSQISLNDLAQRLYLSNAYLSKYIKKHFQLTFMEYVNNVRLFHAVDELLYTKKNITRIALDNGFPASAAFTKAFRDMYGEAPSEYRRKFQNQNEAREYDREISDRDIERIKELISEGPKEDSFQEHEEKLCVVDAEEEGRKLSENHRSICIGEAYSLLQSDVQNQVKDIGKAAGIRYARIWNLFQMEEGSGEKEVRNFRKIDLVIDFLLENGMKPYLELGPKQTVFMYTPDKYLKREKEKNNYPEENFDVLFKEFFLHLVNRYGIGEIENWYFEYRNPIDESAGMYECPEDMKEDGDYYEKFDSLYKIIKEISPKIRFGGAGFILGYDTLNCREILKIWAQREIQPDFLSVYSYQYVAYGEKEQKYGRKSIDVDYMKNQIDIFRKVMKESGIRTEELHISEWNFTISNRNVLNDSCEQGAYILKNCIDMDGEVSMMTYWHALDSYSDYYDADLILNGDSGLVSRDGIHKPSYYAYSFLNRLMPIVLSKDEHSIVTTNKRDRYVIACHNFKKLSSRYVFMEENEIKIEETGNYMENNDAVRLKFRLENVKNGNYLVKIHYVNRERGSVQDIWRRMDYCRNLMRDEMNYLEKSSLPWMEMKNIHVDNGILEIDNCLLGQEIRLLDIQYRYT